MSRYKSRLAENYTPEQTRAVRAMRAAREKIDPKRSTIDRWEVTQDFLHMLQMKGHGLGVFFPDDYHLLGHLYRVVPPSAIEPKGDPGFQLIHHEKPKEDDFE